MKLRPPNLLELIIAGIIMLLWFSAIKMGWFKKVEIADGKQYYKPLVANSYSGIVTAKYLDFENHNMPTIEFKMNDSVEYYYIFETKLYNYILIDDSIINFGIDHIRIKRGMRDSLFYHNATQ